MESVARARKTLRRLRERLAEEDGFTLAELLSAQVIGGFVMAAVVSMLIITFNSTARVTDRINAAAQGRIAMEEIQQRLRSQTCMYLSEYAISRLWRDARVQRIYGGTNEVMKEIVGRSLGL